MASVTRLYSFVLACALLSAPASAQKRPFTFEEMIKVKRVADPQLSPDGKWVAYTSNESGRLEVYVQSFPAGGGRWQISVDGGARPRWNPKGGELFYISPNLELMAVEVRAAATFEYGTAARLFVTRIDNYVAPNRYVVSTDGSRFLMNVPLDEQKANVVTVSINPFE